MRYGQKQVLFTAGGGEVVARPYYLDGNVNLADGLVTDDGRILDCEDEQVGVFAFRDSDEHLYATAPDTLTGV